MPYNVFVAPETLRDLAETILSRCANPRRSGGRVGGFATLAMEGLAGWITDTTHPIPGSWRKYSEPPLAGFKS